MAIFGWQAFLVSSNYSGEAKYIIEQARAVEAAHNTTHAAIYLDGFLAEPFQTAVLAAMRDPARADFFLRDANGNFLTCNVFCRQMRLSTTDPRCLAYYFNWLGIALAPLMTATHRNSPRCL